MRVLNAFGPDKFTSKFNFKAKYSLKALDPDELTKFKTKDSRAGVQNVAGSSHMSNLLPQMLCRHGLNVSER